MPLEVAIALVVGAAVLWVAIVADHRRSRTASASLSLVPHRTRQFMEVIPSGVIVIGRDRRAAASNTLAVGLGLTRPDGALLGEVADLAERAWERGEAEEADVCVRRGVLGADTTVNVRVAPIDDTLALALANDRTEQRVAELTRREFAINVSHELKTPVGALVLLAETIETAFDEPETVREFAAKIGKEARRLSKLIQEIIEITRIQGSESVIDRRPVKLKEVVNEAVDAAQTAAHGRRISLTASCPASATVLGDRDLLVMAVRNLVDNAIAYSDEGGKVTVDVDTDGGVASISIIDQGIGIADAEQERIFERFYRTDPARSRATGGTGLGLSIVKHIVAQHDGEVSVWSRLGVGSTFALRLPLHEKLAS
ncbi:MAG: two-component sensor histidine kinase [Demequinaceae bacterium]|nr:two-component sensor histidine kinase [Demequinaceae bacterium]